MPSMYQALALRLWASVTCSKALTASLYLPACKADWPCWYSMTGSYCGVSGIAADGEPPPPPPPEPIAKTPIGARASTAVAAAPQIILEAIVGILRVVPSGAIMARTIGAVMALSRRVNLALTMLAQAV